MQHFDLAIIGTGSGNSILGPDHAHLDTAIVERGVFGGTCLNRGCIPTKMLVHVAELAMAARDGHRLGVDLTLERVRWDDIRRRIFDERIDPIAAGGADWRRGPENPHVTVFDGSARFVGPKQLEVEPGVVIAADQIVIAAGARPNIPPIPGLSDVPFHTSDDIMRLESLPERLVILGGGFIAMELAHVFDALGVEVVVVNRSEGLLRDQDREVSGRFTEVARARFECHLGVTVDGVSGGLGGITVELGSADGSAKVSGDALLVATGRRPNGDQLDLEATGVEMHSDGRVITDDSLSTRVPGIWALGDVTNSFQLKHLANVEARVVAHNVLHPESPRTVDRTLTPHAVFSSPQIGSVGATEQELEREGRTYLVGRQDYGATAYGWALEDTTGFCKVLVDPDTRLLLGAHVVGPMSASLVQLAVQGMAAGSTVDQLARGLQYVHPAPTELFEQALLATEGVDHSL